MPHRRSTVDEVASLRDACATVRIVQPHITLRIMRGYRDIASPRQVRNKQCSLSNKRYFLLFEDSRLIQYLVVEQELEQTYIYNTLIISI